MKKINLLLIALTIVAYAIHPVVGVVVSTILFYNLLCNARPSFGTFGIFGIRFFNPKEKNSFDGEGIKSGGETADGSAIAYAATLAVPIPTRKAFVHFLDFALLTGALTLNATDVTQYREGDELRISFVVDATGRTVTWGTNFRTGVAATFAMTASQVGLVKATFLGGKWHIYSQTSGTA